MVLIISYAHQVEKVAEEYGSTFTVGMMTQRVGEMDGAPTRRAQEVSVFVREAR